ncbi:MAG: 3-deoxy-D-manno-octulosonic acid transferase, partial [Alphaproteobacteria bacterium]|nr:3-deoxy-D-manno-octulosonic acid transferase [Alphaproteobacteria bacterium]
MQEMLAFAYKNHNLGGLEEGMLLNVYKAMMRAGTPLLEAYLKRREGRGKEDPARAHERRGRAVLPRAPGALAWFHAASVGESLSLLAIISR